MITGHFASISAVGPLRYCCTLRAQDFEVECHARTRREAEESAALALTQELRRREEAAFRAGRLFQSYSLSTRRSA